MTMPKRGCGASMTMRSSRLARAKASAAGILKRCSRASWSSGGSGQRMLSPPGGIAKSSRQDDLDPPGIDRDRGRAVHRLGDGLERHPAAGIARHRPAVEAEIEDLLDPGRVQHRDQRVDKGEFGLVRQGRGFAGMVVAGQRQHAAMRRGAGRVAVLQRVAAAVDPRPLAVPDREHAVIFGAGEQPDLLAAPHRGGGQLLVDRRLELDVVALDKAARAPQRLVEPAERRAAIAGNKAAGIEPGRAYRAGAASAAGAPAPACRSDRPGPFRACTCRRA